MNLNRFNELIFDTDDIVKGLYSGKIKKLSELNISNHKLIKQFNQSVEQNADNIPLISEYKEPETTVKEFDQNNQSQWFIPIDHCPDLIEQLYKLCDTQEKRERVDLELKLFAQHNMIDVLHALKYLVDFMRSENIVWGLGRGSSVASYCLFLIGVHKVDSLKYQLDIQEFLKGD
jgi:DNA polymerase III alpha subunit